MASKVARGVGATHFLVATHWLTYFGHFHRRIPAPTRAKDHDALRDLVEVQSFGRESLALDLIEQIVEAPIPGDSFSARYTAFWAWTQSRQPKRYAPPSRSLAAEIRRCIRGAA